MDESCPFVETFVSKLVSDLLYLESKIFEIKFCLGEIPNDMKMLAFLAGELTNSATYFLHLLMYVKKIDLTSKNHLV